MMGVALARGCALICRAVSKPFITGMRTSSKITAKSSCSRCRRASFPEEAVTLRCRVDFAEVTTDRVTPPAPRAYLAPSDGLHQTRSSQYGTSHDGIGAVMMRYTE